MDALERTRVKVRFFETGSVEQVASACESENLNAARQLVRQRFPDAAFVRCCEHESDGGCVFVYANGDDLRLDEQDASVAKDALPPDSYGRWIGMISSAAADAPNCERPSSHGI